MNVLDDHTVAAFANADRKNWDTPPEHLLAPEQNLAEPIRPRASLPEVTDRLADAQGNPNAKQLDELGQAIRAGLGIGALSLLPELIEDLRRSKDPDTRIKFLALAIKEGGYGLKEDKTSQLPVFHFNFVGSGTTVTTERAAPAEIIEDAVYAKHASSAYNDDVLPPEATPPELAPESIFDLIEGI